MTYDPSLDPGVEKAVVALNAAGVATFEPCEGGCGHAYPEPTKGQKRPADVIGAIKLARIATGKETDDVEDDGKDKDKAAVAAAGPERRRGASP